MLRSGFSCFISRLLGLAPEMSPVNVYSIDNEEIHLRRQLFGNSVEIVNSKADDDYYWCVDCQAMININWIASLDPFLFCL